MWPFSRKNYQDVENPLLNKFLEAVFKFQIHNGTAQVIQDKPTEYLSKGYSGNDDVYSLINRIVRMSTQARLALYTKDASGKWIEDTNHELTRFLRAVNPTMKTGDFIAGHLIYKLAVGNSYWYKPVLESGLNKGKTNELWLLPANDVEILGGPSWTNPVGGYRLRHNTQTVFTTEEVYHAKFFNPLFGYDGSLYGQSPLKAAARVISKQNEAILTELKQFENQSPPYILFRDSDSLVGWTDEQRKELQRILKEHAKGKDRGSILALHEKVGKIDVGVSPVDLNILNSSLDGRKRLCNILGFPSILMGDSEASTFANAAEARKAAWSDCIKPNLTDLASDLTSCLIDPVAEYKSKNLFFEFDYSQVMELQADLQKQVAWMIQAKWTPNEIREATGQKPFDNPAMDEPWMGVSEMPLSQATTDILTQPSLKNFGDY